MIVRPSAYLGRILNCWTNHSAKRKEFSSKHLWDQHARTHKKDTTFESFHFFSYPKPYLALDTPTTGYLFSVEQHTWREDVIPYLVCCCLHSFSMYILYQNAYRPFLHKQVTRDNFILPNKSWPIGSDHSYPVSLSRLPYLACWFSCKPGVNKKDKKLWSSVHSYKSFLLFPSFPIHVQELAPPWCNKVRSD